MAAGQFFGHLPYQLMHFVKVYMLDIVEPRFAQNVVHELLGFTLGVQ